MSATKYQSQMKKSRNININGIGPVLFEHSVRAKRIIISIRPQKGVRVAIPDHTSFKSALEFVYAKEIRIRKHLAKIEQCQNQGRVMANALATIEKVSSRKKLTTRLKQLAEKHGFIYNRVFVRNQETLWGSCSCKNNISLNMKLVILPKELIDYVILHELVHIRIHNHSKNFWAELDKYVGNGRVIASRLRKYDTRWIRLLLFN